MKKIKTGTNDNIFKKSNDAKNESSTSISNGILKENENCNIEDFDETKKKLGEKFVVKSKLSSSDSSNNKFSSCLKINTNCDTSPVTISNSIQLQITSMKKTIRDMDNYDIRRNLYLDNMLEAMCTILFVGQPDLLQYHSIDAHTIEMAWKCISNKLVKPITKNNKVNESDKREIIANGYVATDRKLTKNIIQAREAVHNLRFEQIGDALNQTILKVVKKNLRNIHNEFLKDATKKEIYVGKDELKVKVFK